MPETRVVAKKDFLPLFKIEDNLTIIPVLYEEDTCIVNEIYGVFDKNNKLIKIAEKSDFLLGSKSHKKLEIEIKLMFDKVYAPKGSYKHSYIKLENGSIYPGSIIRNYEDYFKKIKE